MDDWENNDRTRKEYESFGFHLLAHPLEKYEIELRSFTNYAPGGPPPQKTEILKTGGIITEAKVHFDRNNRQMAFCQLEGIEGTTELVVFSDVYERYKELINREESMVLVTGKNSDRDESEVKIMANEFIPLEESKELLTELVMVDIDLNKHSPEVIKEIRSIAGEYEGKCRFGFTLKMEGGESKNIISSSVSVEPERKFFKKIIEILGENSITLMGAGYR